MIHTDYQEKRTAMRCSGIALAESFRQIFDMIRPGVSIKTIDLAMEKAIIERGAKPAFKGYRPTPYDVPYPNTTCISIDHQIVHGIPKERPLEEGQLVSIDAGLVLNKWFADMAITFMIGEVTPVKKKLHSVTKQALYRGIERANVGNRVYEIGIAIQDYVEEQDFNVIRELVGHGIGRNLHEEPQVPNYRHYNANTELSIGQAIAIEPMVAVGTWRTKMKRDGWTVETADLSPAAHFEHTVLVTEKGPEIMTLLEDGTDPWQVAPGQ